MLLVFRNLFHLLRNKIFHHKMTKTFDILHPNHLNQSLYGPLRNECYVIVTDNAPFMTTRWFISSFQALYFCRFSCSQLFHSIWYNCIISNLICDWLWAHSAAVIALWNVGSSVWPTSNTSNILKYYRFWTTLEGMEFEIRTHMKMRKNGSDLNFELSWNYCYYKTLKVLSDLKVWAPLVRYWPLGAIQSEHLVNLVRKTDPFYRSNWHCWFGPNCNFSLFWL